MLSLHNCTMQKFILRLFHISTIFQYPSTQQVHDLISSHFVTDVMTWYQWQLQRSFIQPPVKNTEAFIYF